jgi:hypothetical protein
VANKVLASFEDQFHERCVDTFVRDDGTFGFEEFRSESDGDSRWQSLHRHARLSFASGEQALHEAEARVARLGDRGPWRW